MTRFLASAALAASMLAAAPAVAQDYRNAPAYSSQGYANQGYANQGYGTQGSDFWRGAPSDTWQRISYLEQRIQAGQSDGSLSPEEARRAELQLRQIRRDAMRMRRGGYMSASSSAQLQSRLDALSRNIRWARRNGERGGYGQGYGTQGYGAQGYAGGYQTDPSRFTTDYDARRYYREGPQYSERRLSDADEVYRGSDGRYYCKRSDGTTGLIVGGAVGGVLGNVVDGGRNRVAGTLIGGALGALLGRSVEQNSDIRCR
jgi:opacity protein-like surface antigen